MTEDFSKHPLTIGELQRQKVPHCDVGKPRDILIEMLRDIDEGKVDPSAMVICYRIDEEGETFSHFISACPDGIIAMGLLTRVIHKMNE